MAHRKISFIFVLVPLVVSLSGCAAFRSGETQPPESWPLSKGPGKQSISLLVTGEGSVNGVKQDLPQRMIEAWQGIAEKSYKDSGLFSDVKTGAAETDLRAEIHFIDRGEASQGLAFLSGFTMTLIPANGKSELTVKTTLKDKAAQALGTFEKKETLSFWIQFFLIFIMPFYWPNTVATDMLYDLNRATINEALGAGVLRAQHMTIPVEWARAAE